MQIPGSLDTNKKFMAYSHTVGLCVMQGRGFMYPVDTLIADNGRMHTISRAYTSAAHNLRITIYDTDGEYYGVYGGYGSDLGKFIWPSSIAADHDGNVFVSDEQLDRITIYTSDGSPISYWGTKGDQPGELNGPASLAFDKNNDIFVSDHQNNRVQKFTKDGVFILSFGDKGENESKLNLPWGITVGPDNLVYVADWANHRVNKYSKEGDYIQSFGSYGNMDGQFTNPSSVAVDSDGSIYVADWGNERVQILDSDGQFITKLRGEATISRWAQEFLDANYEEAEPRSRSNMEPDLGRFGGNPHEESAHTEKFFWGPTSVKIDSAGSLYVTESNRHRVQIYKPNSKA